MRAHWIWAIVLLAAPAFAAETATRGPRAGDVSFGGGAVYYVPGDGTGRWGPSVLGRYYLADRVATEASVDYRNESYPNDVTAHTGAGQLSLLGLLGTGDIFRLEPLVGLGYYVSRLNSGDSNRNLGRFAAHLGIGVEAWPGSQKLWSVVLSYRHVWLADMDTGTAQFKRAGEQLNFSLVRKFGALKR